MEISKLEVLIVDLETTGFSHKNDDIVEIGIVKIDLKTGRKAKIFDNLIRPTKSLEQLKKAWIIKEGYIDVDSFESSNTLEDYRPLIQYILNSFPLGITAFNNNFDFGFLEANGFEIPKKLPCPMKLSTDICKIPSNRGYKWPNVDEAYKHFFPNNKYKEIHRGCDDAFHEADIVKALYDLGTFKID